MDFQWRPHRRNRWKSTWFAIFTRRGPIHCLRAHPSRAIPFWWIRWWAVAYRWAGSRWMPILARRWPFLGDISFVWNRTVWMHWRLWFVTHTPMAMAKSETWALVQWVVNGTVVWVWILAERSSTATCRCIRLWVISWVLITPPISSVIPIWIPYISKIKVRKPWCRAFFITTTCIITSSVLVTDGILIIDCFNTRLTANTSQHRATIWMYSWFQLFILTAETCALIQFRRLFILSQAPQAFIKWPKDVVAIRWQFQWRQTPKPRYNGLKRQPIPSPSLRATNTWSTMYKPRILSLWRR